ncbi:MAG TPA: cadherin domain-containing protein, partial [Ramlibacter sp.]|nr:cadherin domain-containing protein [Ramlibacter sp.]
AKFSIDATTGVLTFASAPDYESAADADGNNTYVVEVTASDGNGSTSVQTITATVTNINEAISITGDATAAMNAAENQTAVTTVAASDIDGDTPSFSITGGADQAKFSIDATTGVLTFVSASNFESAADADDNNTYLVEVTASDGNGSTSVQTITATVTNVNEAISITGGATAAVNAAENQTSVATVEASDIDDDTPSFYITGGADQAKFSIDATTGVLSFASAPDYESPGDADGDNTYMVQVTASDGNGSTSVQTITASVANVNEAIVPPPRPADPPAAPQPPKPALDELEQVSPPAAVFFLHKVPSLNALPLSQDLPLVSSAAQPRPALPGTASAPTPEPLPATVARATPLPFVRLGAADAAAAGADTLTAVPRLGAAIVTGGREVLVELPEGTFTHSSGAAAISVTAQQADGKPLPAWLRFDPLTGRLFGVAPAGFIGTVKIQLIARDTQGLAAITLIDIVVDDAVEAPSGGAPAEPSAPERRAGLDAFPGRPGLSEQLQHAGQRGTVSSRLAALPRGDRPVTRHG